MKHLLFICTLLLCIACKEDKSVDPTIMPQATTSGQNTFGCVIDGWLYASGRWGIPTASYIIEGENDTEITINAEVNFSSYIHFIIINPKQGETTSYTDASFDTQSLEDGNVYITRMSDGIISGTFKGTRMLEGRFDLKYSE
ncbi:hypothetical protein [uncultured Bacteroides sp.]|uniref:hypothetical protein n=1 Tax=uncultured Bacteroides sp. TaxID=162156 RepID=UPI002AA828BF|nr:hypothetical protein [uncultured Bacteroides sp.]